MQNLRNNIDFFLRNLANFSLSIPRDEETNVLALCLQTEMIEFFQLFDWNSVLFDAQNSSFVIADVGTRTFAIAPPLDQFFRKFNLNPEVHGIEIDAYRRFTNLRSRADYGKYYAQQIPNGHFHAIDFLKWNEKCDLVCLLNPFVTKDPLLNWGLPLKEFKPKEIFNHAKFVLEKSSAEKSAGLLLISSPTVEEFEISVELATRFDFKLIEEKTWLPSDSSNQKQPRIGALFTTK